MDITHPGQQLILFFDVFVGFFLYTFYCLFRILELFCLFWCIYLCYWFGFYLSMFNKYHFSFVYFCCFVLCLCIHIYVYIFMPVYDSFIYLYLFPFIYFEFCIYISIYLYIYIHFFWIIVMWTLSFFIEYVYVCRWIYALFRIHLFTCMLFMWIEKSWCKHSHVNTCSGGWNRYG